MNTDRQALSRSQAKTRVQIGEKEYTGQRRRLQAGGWRKGCRGEPRADRSYPLKGADMVFVTAGMGGGTARAAPVVAEIAKDMGALTVGIVTNRSLFEGKRRMDQAEKGHCSCASVDSLVVIPNERLKLVSEQRITLANAFSIADDVLRQGVQSIPTLSRSRHRQPRLRGCQVHHAGCRLRTHGCRPCGRQDKAEQAAVAAISSPLLETAIAGAKGVIINIKSSPDIALDRSMSRLNSSPSAQARMQTSFGVLHSTRRWSEMMMVTVIATGFDGMNGEKTQKPATPAISDADLFGNPSAPSTVAQLPRRATMIPSPTSCPSSTESNLELQIKQGIGLDTLSL